MKRGTVQHLTWPLGSYMIAQSLKHGVYKNRNNSTYKTAKIPSILELVQDYFALIHCLPGIVVSNILKEFSKESVCSKLSILLRPRETKWCVKVTHLLSRKDNTYGRFRIFLVHLFTQSDGVCNSRFHRPMTEVSKSNSSPLKDSVCNYDTDNHILITQSHKISVFKVRYFNL